MKIHQTVLNNYQRDQYEKHRELAHMLLKFWQKKGKPLGYIPFKYQGGTWKMYVFKYMVHPVTHAHPDLNVRGITVWDHQGHYAFMFDVSYK